MAVSCQLSTTRHALVILNGTRETSRLRKKLPKFWRKKVAKTVAQILEKVAQTVAKQKMQNYLHQCTIRRSRTFTSNHFSNLKI